MSSNNSFVISCVSVNSESWCVSCDISFNQYKCIISLDDLGSTSLLGMFLRKRPDEFKKIFDTNSYKTTMLEDGIVLSCNVVCIDESFDILLKLVVCNDSDREKKILNMKISELQETVRVQEERLMSQEDQIIDSQTRLNMLEKNKVSNQTYYPNCLPDSFKIPMESLIAFAKEFVPDYIDFRSKQVNSTENEIMEKYKLVNVDSMSKVTFSYMAQVRNMSFYKPIVQYMNTQYLLSSGSFIMCSGCWIPKKDSVNEIKPEINDSILFIQYNSYMQHQFLQEPFIIISENVNRLSEDDKKRLNLK